MKVRVNVGKVQVEAEGSTLAETYEQLAKLEEIFACQGSCGMPGCKNEVLVHRVRKDAKKRKYFELYCPKCKGVFRFGQHQEEAGSLFPQRKDKAGKFKPNNGWERYTPKEEV